MSGTDRKLKSPGPSVFLGILVSLLGSLSLSDPMPTSSEAEDEKPFVVVEIGKDWSSSYKDRRSFWGVDFAIHSEAGKLREFTSPFDGKDFQNSFQTNEVRFVSLDLGVRTNFPVVSLISGLSFGTSEVTSPIFGTRLSLVKKAVHFQLLADAIFSEPYVAPYVGIHFFNLDYTLSQGESKETGSTPSRMGTRYGLLVQINSLDPDGVKDGRREYGLQNAYLDLFLSTYPAGSKTLANGSPGPDMSWNNQLGVGLKLEY